MQQAIDIGKKMYAHSFVRYVLIGGTTFVLDFALLVFLHGVCGINVLVAASISYWVSIAFNFFANRHWSFEAKDSPIARHLVFYCSLLGINYLFTIGFIAVSGQLGLHYTIAKVLSVVIQISWTYVAYKKVVFR